MAGWGCGIRVLCPRGSTLDPKKVEGGSSIAQKAEPFPACLAVVCPCHHGDTDAGPLPLRDDPAGVRLCPGEPLQAGCQLPAAGTHHEGPWWLGKRLPNLLSSLRHHEGAGLDGPVCGDNALGLCSDLWGWRGKIMAVPSLRGPPAQPCCPFADPHPGVLQRVPLPGPASPGEEAEFPAHIPAP